MLRREGVVGKFVEFIGPGVTTMGVPDRATIANMAPEYGATMGFFPVDAQSLEFLRRTGRSPEQVELVERYTKELGIFRTDESPVPEFSKLLRLDLTSVEPSLAGPKRPQDRVPLSAAKQSLHQALRARLTSVVLACRIPLSPHRRRRVRRRAGDDRPWSCGDRRHHQLHQHEQPVGVDGGRPAGQKSGRRGLKVQPYVKTSLAPGSRVVSDYLDQAGLTSALEQLGFHTVGYGCTTCIGNSGPLPDPVAKAVTGSDLVAAAVLSGNRNFEGRVNPLVKANYLASPPLVVAYALAGTLDIDLLTEPLGQDDNGAPVYLRDIWPSAEEIRQAVDDFVKPEMFQSRYATAFDATEEWSKLEVSSGDLYSWSPDSTYLQQPPFLNDVGADLPPASPIRGARVLALLGDSVTTDHISPAGSIAKDSPAGRYLVERGVPPAEFNSYGSRRGNDQIMIRGTFANIRIRNQLVPGIEGGWTRHLPSGEPLTIYDAAMRYRSEGVPLVILAGTEYGTGSSRDWAAKGTYLLGVRAVLAASYERIHRSNLVGMGVLPLEFVPGQTWQSLGLNGEEICEIAGLGDDLQPGSTVTVTAERDGKSTVFPAVVRIDTPVELEYYRHGGILQTVLRKMRYSGQ